MDEEDGRPGARAVKSGPLDARCGVSTPSLQIHVGNKAVILSAAKDPLFAMLLHHHIPMPHPRGFFLSRGLRIRVPRSPVLGPGIDFRTSKALIQIEENYENVPGK
jgi:hypothetical protein